MTRKEEYEERRRQEHENEMVRLRMQRAHYEKQAIQNEVGELIVRAVEAFFLGKATLVIEPVNDVTQVRFVMPQADGDGEEAARRDK